MTVCGIDVVKNAVTVALLAVLMVHAAFTPQVFAANDAARKAAVGSALDHLQSTQQPNGSWDSSGQGATATSAAAFAMLSQKRSWGEKSAAFQTATERAIEYLVRNAVLQNVGDRLDGAAICPGGLASCHGIYWYDGTNSALATGLAAAAITIYASEAGLEKVATEAGPLAGMSWAVVLQGISNVLLANQVVGGNPGAGGWSAVLPGDGNASVVATRWASMALAYAESVGSETPTLAKNELKRYLGNLANADGAICDDASQNDCGLGASGGWLLGMRYSGFDVSNAQVRATLSWMNARWATGIDSGANADTDAMFALYAGLESTVGLQDLRSIQNQDLRCDVATNQFLEADACNWWGDLNSRLIAGQRGDGSWAASASAGEVVATALNAAVLGGIHIPLERISCPSGESFWMSTLNAWPTDQLNLGSKQYSQKEIIAILGDGSDTVAGGSDMSIALLRALTAARLNVMRGSDATQINRPMAVADQLLRERPGRLPFGIEPASILGVRMADSVAALDSYNRGFSSTGCPTSGSPANSPGGIGGVIGVSVVPVYPVVSGPVSNLPRSLNGIRIRHREGVTAMAVSQDGETIATAGSDKAIRTWEASTGRQKQVLRGTLGLPSGLVLTADGKTLCSVSADSEIRIWNLQTGKETARLRGHEHGIRALAISADGNTLASSGEETRILIWDLAARKLLSVLHGPTDFVNSVAFSPDGSLLAVADESSRVLVISLAGGGTVHTLRGHTGPVDTVSFSPDGRMLASSGVDGTILLWDASTGQRLNTLRAHGSAVRTIAYSPDGALLASGGADGRVFLWRPETGAVDRELSGVKGAVNVLLFSDNGSYLVGADQSGEIVVWNTETNGKSQTIPVPNEP